MPAAANVSRAALVPAGVDPSPPLANPISRVNVSAVRLSLDVSMLATMSASGGEVDRCDLAGAGRRGAFCDVTDGRHRVA